MADCLPLVLNLLDGSLKFAAGAFGVECVQAVDGAVARMEGDSADRERDRLARVAEAKRAELRTLENNLGFLSAKSKSGNSLIQDFERKIERLREDIAEISDKIKMLAR